MFLTNVIPNCTNQLFVVDVVHSESRPIAYGIVDRLGEKIKARFYEQELAKTKYSYKNSIEKIIRHKGDKVLVKLLVPDNS